MSEVSPRLRRLVEERAGGRCEYCHVASETQVAPYNADHVVPVSRGGPTELGNLAWSCGHCNSHKWAYTSGIDSVTRTVVPMFHPRRDRWDEHFRWSDDDPAVLEGITPTGRVTIERLQMNYPAVVQARRLIRRCETESGE